MVNSQDMLYKMSKEELKKVLLFPYEMINNQLTPEEKKLASFDQIVNDVYKNLQTVEAKIITPTSFIPFSSEADYYRYIIDTRIWEKGLSPCLQKILIVVVDTAFILAGFIGLRDALARRFGNAILKALNYSILNGFQSAIFAIKEATDLGKKAFAVAKFIGEISNAIGFSGIIKALQSSLSWYDWLLTAVTIIAQLAAWFASSFVALIAELTLLLAKLPDYIKHIGETYNACKG